MDSNQSFPPQVKLDGRRNNGGRRAGAGRKKRQPVPEDVIIRIHDLRPLSLRARDLTHLALGGLQRVLNNPESQGSAIVNAAREILDRGFGRAVELKRTQQLGPIDGLTDDDLEQLIQQLQAFGRPVAQIEGAATASTDPTQSDRMGEVPGAQTSSTPPPPPEPTAEGR